MPANLPPQYYELEREFKDERDPREKLRLAEELLRMMPKHKGTDHLRADLRTDLIKWMFTFWIGTLAPLAGLVVLLTR